MRMKRQGFLKSSAILLAMIIITKALGILYKVPLTLLLGGEGMGHLSAAMSVFAPVFAAAVSGITPAVAKLTAENCALRRFANMRKTRRTAMRLFGLLGAAGCALLIAAAPLLSKLSGSSGSPAAVICAAPTLLFCALMSVEKGYYEGLSNMVPTAVSEIAESVFRLVCGLGLGYAAGRVMGLSSELCAAAAILGTSAASMLGCIVIFVMTLRRGDGISKADLESDPVTDSSRRIRSSLMTVCAPIALTTVVNSMSGLIDLMTIPRGLTAAAVKAPHLFDRITAAGIRAEAVPNFVYGSYTALALTIFGFVPTVTAMLSKSLLPEITAAHACGDKVRLNKSLSRLIRAAALIAMPAGALIMIRPEEILSLLFGPRATEIYACREAFMILGAAAVFSGIAAPCFAALQLTGRPREGIKIMVGSAAVKLALNLLLVRMPQLGISGAAVSTLGSVMFIMELCLYRLRRLTGGRLRPAALMIKPMYAAGLAMAAAAAVPEIPEKRLFAGGGERAALCVTLLFSCIVYGISLVLLCEMPKNKIKRSFFKKKL